jgi:hypothetical protein
VTSFRRCSWKSGAGPMLGWQERRTCDDIDARNKVKDTLVHSGSRVSDDDPQKDGSRVVYAHLIRNRPVQSFFQTTIRSLPLWCGMLKSGSLSYTSSQAGPSGP